MPHDLPAPARRLYEILLGQADQTGNFQLSETWVALEVGCGTKRLREYRGNLVSAGLLAVRKFGPLLIGTLAPAASAELPPPAERAKSATLPLFDDPDAREKCHASEDERAKSATRDDDAAREKCHAPTAERAKSATLDNSTRGTFCHGSARKLPRVALSATVARENCHAEPRAREGRKVGRLTTRVKLINTYLPTPQPPAWQFSRAASAVDVDEPPAAPIWQVAPTGPDYTRNRDLLEDAVLGLEDGPSIDFLARSYAFEDLLRQVFAHLRAAERQNLGPGALVHRCKRHLADPRQFIPQPLSRSERASALYRRHVELVAPPVAEPEPEPEPPAPPLNLPERDDPVWEIARTQLRLQLPQSTYDAWIKDTRGEFDADGRLTVYAPNAMAVDWLRLRLRRLVEQTLLSIKGERVEVEFVYREEALV